MTEQEITQARSDVDQLDIEQLRCGVLLQLLHIERLTKERDELRLQIDIQAGSIEAVQAANQRLAGERYALQSRVNQQAAMVEKSVEEMNRNANIGAQAGKERDALAANHKDCVQCLGEALQDRADLAAAAKRALDAIAALRQAGVQ